MKNLTPEMIDKAKAAKSAEELLGIAKANGVELTAEEAKTYFEQLHVNSAVSDDDLDTVAGGSEGGCGNDDEEKEEKKEEEKKEPNITPTNSMKCPFCGSRIPRLPIFQYSCPKCDKIVDDYVK
jgi:predicted ribosomally synthesized peptide with nif11-like leader